MGLDVSPSEAARTWARAWKEGWEALNADPIVACYSPDVVFSTEPFRAPYHGREGVREYTLRAFAAEREPRVRMSEPIVDGDRASVSWWTTLIEEGQDATLAGTSVLRFDSRGLVVEQWDTWNQHVARVDPPGGTPFER